MKMPVVLFSTLLLTAVNILASLFWYPAFRFAVCREEFNQKFTLPHGLTLDSFDAGFPYSNLGTAIADRYGEPVFHKGLQLPPDQGVVEAIDGYTIQSGSVVVKARLSAGDAVHVKINEDLSLTRLTDTVSRRDRVYIDLRDDEVEAWSRYRHGDPSHFWLLTLLFGLSLCINVFLVKVLVRMFRLGSYRGMGTGLHQDDEPMFGGRATRTSV